MRILIALLSLLLCVTSDKTFFETENTFARYRSWVLTGKGILKFSFRTYKQNALLLYTDGGAGAKDFLKLQIVNEQLIVQTDFGSGRVIFDIGSDLSDGKFHTVQINVQEGLMTVYLDERISKEQTFDNFATDNVLQLQTPVYIGGVNKYIEEELVEADMPLEPRFSGCINNFRFTRADGETFGKPMTEAEEGVVDNCEDTLCDTTTLLDSCRNGGTCEPQQDSWSCNCEGTGYSGNRCTTAATVAKFQASEYIKYRTQDDPTLTKFDSLSFRLKTSRENGLVFYYRTDNYFMAVEIVSNFMSINVGFGNKQQLLTLDNTYISDNTWHEVHIGRYESFVTLEVDNVQKQAQLAHPSPVLYNKDIYIGGGETLLLMDGVRTNLNFVGCLQQLTFNKKQMLKEAKSDVRGYSTSGHVEWTCSDIQYVPVMFGSSDAKLELDKWMINRDLSLQFKTSNSDGVIAFTGTDAAYLALELIEGRVVFSAYKDGETYEARVGSNLADGKWHSLTARYDNTGIVIHIYGDIGDVEEDQATFRVQGDLNLKSGLMLGVGEAGAPSLRTGYRGCIRGFSIQQEVIDLYTRLANQPPGVVAGCSSLEEACAIQPCYHGSICNQEMNTFTCDCTGTGYEGPVCSTESPSLTFSGSQYLRYLTNIPVNHNRDTISFRFRSQAEAGLLMYVTNDYKFNSKYMYFEIINSQLFVFVNYGVSKFFSMDTNVADGRWHVVLFKREGNSLTLRLDNKEVRHTIPLLQGSPVTFPYKYTYLGSGPTDEWRYIHRMTKSKRAFDGCLQQATLNSVNLISNVASAMIVSNARPGCKFQETTEQQIAAFVRPSYVSLPPWQFNNASSSINFHFRTEEDSGLLLFHGDLAKDWVAVELQQGRLKTTLQIGDGSRTVSSLVTGLNNNVWHNVSLAVSHNEFSFEVDDMPMHQPLAESNFDFNGGLYLGGVPENVNVSLLPYTMQATPHFIGCVKALIVNRVIQDLLQAGNDKSGVRPECEGSCAAYPCDNGGSCRQLEDRYDCVCTGTFYKGQTCSDDMTKVRFTAGSSLSYSLYDHKRTIRDDLHIKFKTSNSDGGLVQIETHDPNQFITLVLKNEYLELSLKMANKKIFVRSPTRVNDDTPHTLSLWRRNTEISYSFDGQTASQATLGVTGTVEFGVIMKIILGGTANNRQFSGCMLGFDYNGMTPLENTNLPNVKKSPGLIEGSCEINPVTSSPDDVTTPENEAETPAEGDNNNNNNNRVETATPKPVIENNTTTVQTQVKDAPGLGLPIILIIAVGGFLLMLLIIYGVSRFARRRQGVYKTNEDKRISEHQRADYDKLTIHDEAFELPPKRELYM